MEAIKVQTYIPKDGILRLELPVSLSQRRVEVFIVMQPLEAEAVDEMGYPIGYFEETYGILADEPMERPAQLPDSVRDEIE